MPYFEFVVTIVCAVGYYRVGTAEEAPGLLWAALSVAISLVIWLGFGRGGMAMVAGQLVLFAGITVFRVVRDPQ